MLSAMTDGVLPAGPAATEAGRHAQVSATQTVTGGDAALIAPLLVTFRFPSIRWWRRRCRNAVWLRGVAVLEML